MDFEEKIMRVAPAIVLAAVVTIVSYRIDSLEERMTRVEAGDVTYTTPSKYDNFVGLDEKPSKIIKDFTPPKEEQK